MSKLLSSAVTASGLKDYMAECVNPSLRPEIVEKASESISPFLEMLAQRQDLSCERLKNVFRRQAQTTGLLISSDFSCLSWSDFKKFDASHSRNAQGHKFTNFAVTSVIRDSNFGVGFVQRISNHHTYAHPVLAISDIMMKQIKGANPELLINALTDLYTMGNHDYLHHLIPESTGDNIAKAHCGTGEAMSQLLRVHFVPHGKKELGVETFMILSHAESFKMAFEFIPEFEDKYRKTCNIFLDEIEKIKNFILENNNGFAGEKKANQFVNYFGIAGLFGMARVIDIQHDKIAQDFSARLLDFDPLPGYAPDRQKKSGLAKLFITSQNRKHREPESHYLNHEIKAEEVLELSPRLAMITSGKRWPSHYPFVARVGRIEGEVIAAIEQDIAMQPA